MDIGMWSACGLEEMVIRARETTVFKDTGQHIWDHMGMGWLYGFTNFRQKLFSCTRNDRYWIVERLRFGANGANEAANGANEAANGAEPGHLFLSLESKLTNKSAKPENKSRPVHAKLIFV